MVLLFLRKGLVLDARYEIILRSFSIEITVLDFEPVGNVLEILRPAVFYSRTFVLFLGRSTRTI